MVAAILVDGGDIVMKLTTREVFLLGVLTGTALTATVVTLLGALGGVA